MNKQQLNGSMILGFIFSVTFFWIFFFSIWYSNNIINQEKFVTTVTTVLESESVRNSISDEIVSTVKMRRPVIGSIAAPLLTKIIAGVMDSNLFSSVDNKVAQELHLQLTSANPRELYLDISPAKQFLSPFIERADPELLKAIPDKVVVIKKNQIPSLYKFGTYLTILGPILLIVGLLILGLIWTKIADKRNYITILSLTIAASGLLIYFLVPAIGSYLTAQADSVSIASVISQIYLAFTSPISKFALEVLAVSLIVAVVSKFARRELFRLPKENTSKVK